MFIFSTLKSYFEMRAPLSFLTATHLCGMSKRALSKTDVVWMLNNRHYGTFAPASPSGSPRNADMHRGGDSKGGSV